MDYSKLIRYQNLFTNSRRMGADHIFNNWCNIAAERAVPMSIAHGVDLGLWPEPIDIEKAEPIHWVHNLDIYKRAIQVKPTLLAPHPLMMIKDNSEIKSDLGTLVIAAPPGIKNDQSLLDRIRNYPNKVTILVKPKGNYKSSITFWERNGFRAMTLGEEGTNFYLNLHNLLSRFNHIIGCNFSSILIYAAALGKTVEVITDYWYDNYIPEPENFKLSNITLKNLLNSFNHRNQDEYYSTCRYLLGANYSTSPAKITQEYYKIISELDWPIYVRKSNNAASRWLYSEVARLSGKVGVLNNFSQGIKDIIFGKKMHAVEISEISLYLYDKPEKYLRSSRVKYIKGITEGGLAVSSYK